MKRLLLGAVPAALALALTGCSGSSPSSEASRTPRTTAAPVVTPPPPNHACYDLDVKVALALSSSAPAVPCSQRHTSVTVFVGRVKPVGGRDLAIEAPAVQRQIARTCRTKVDRHVGGSKEAQRLSRVQAVWFSPTTAQARTGARWFRCDLVIAGTTTAFVRLPVTTRGLLAKDGALNRYGTCGTASPAAPGFRRVVCAAPHTWRVRASIDLPPGTRYLAKAAGKRADSTCRDIEARRATTLTTLRWSFEWPTAMQWRNGQRYGLCWTPS